MVSGYLPRHASIQIPAEQIRCRLLWIDNKKPPPFLMEVSVFAIPTFLGRPTYCPAVRKCPVDTCRQKKAPTFQSRLLVFALPIFPGSRPPSIVGVHVLNFCVRDGNRWTHMTINTNYSGYTLKTEHCILFLHYSRHSLSLRFGQAFGLLVSVSYTHYCASTSDLSTT